MATDYDSPRKTDDELTEDSLQELQARRMDKSSTAIDIDPDDIAESLELPGADLSNEELSFRVIPRQADEFTCSSCFLVHHRSQLADNREWPAGLPGVRCLAAVVIQARSRIAATAAGAASGPLAASALVSQLGLPERARPGPAADVPGLRPGPQRPRQLPASRELAAWRATRSGARP